jgi:DNA polymerase beta
MNNNIQVEEIRVEKAVIIKWFKLLSKVANNNRDDPDGGFRVRAWKKCVKSLENPDVPQIINRALFKTLPGVGKGSIERFDEIVTTGQLAEVTGGAITGDDTPNSSSQVIDDGSEEAMATFIQICGVAEKTAAHFIELGYRTIADITNNYWNYLTPAQQIGITYYNDLLEKIPRHEIRRVRDMIKSVLLEYNEEKNKEALSADSAEQKLPFNITADVCGSFRRGALQSGDIDIVLVNKGENTTDISWQNDIVALLFEMNFIQERLAHGGFIFRGICKFPDLQYYRRIDLFFAPRDSWGCMILFSTGSGDFNMSMREEAKRKGFKLAQINLTAPDGSIIPCPTEKDVFRALNLPYVKPSDRR